MLVGRANELAELDRLVSGRTWWPAVPSCSGSWASPGWAGPALLEDEAAAWARGQGLAVVQVAAVEVEAWIPGTVVALVEAALQSAHPGWGSESQSDRLGWRRESGGFASGLGGRRRRHGLMHPSTISW